MLSVQKLEEQLEELDGHVARLGTILQLLGAASTSGAGGGGGSRVAGLAGGGSETPRAMRACSARWARPSHTSATPEGAARFPGCRVDAARGDEAQDLDE